MTASLLIEAHEDGLQAVGGALLRMRKLAQSPRPVWEAISQYGETSTRIRFRDETGPDGARWKPSRPVRKNGGKTLQLTARLLRSIHHQASASSGEWGTNVVYAGIHQFGGTISRLAHSSSLRLRTDAGGRLLRQPGHAKLAVFAKATHRRAVEKRYTVGAHQVKMPARPFLGVNADDGREILRLAHEAVDQAAAGPGAA